MGLLFYSAFGGASLALFYWVYRSIQTHLRSWHQRETTYQTGVLVCASLLHLIAIIGWLILALTNISALVRELVPGGPAPFFLAPWFTGFFIMGIAQLLAEGLDAIARKDYDRFRF